MKNFFTELEWRGLVHNATPDFEKLVSSQSSTGYIGFDPTASSLHIGSLVPVTLLMRFQKYGHKPLAIVGGATGMIGDPSGKSAERTLLDKEKLEENLLGIRKQLEQFLDFGASENSAELLNNYDWMESFSFLDFLRDVGKYINISYMIHKDSVKDRLQKGLSFTEFSYQLLQAYDFCWLYENKNCQIQMGGSDQWGNITTGNELIQKKLGKTVHALTCPLVTKADGSKFGKSASGENIWLDKEKTSPYKFYQYWINASDEDAKKYCHYFSFHNKKTISELLEEHNTAPHLRLLQKELARELTEMVHSKKDLTESEASSEIIFGKGNKEALRDLNKRTFLDVFEGVPCFSLSKEAFQANTYSILELLSEANAFNSKGEIRRAVQGNSVSLNFKKVENAETIFEKIDLLHEKYIVLQKGKKNFFLIELT